jgi:ribonuclease HI
MKLIEMSMEIVKEKQGWFWLEIRGEGSSCEIRYSPELKKIQFPESETSFSSFIKEHQYQMSKILRNKRKDTFYVGFFLIFILWKDKDVGSFNDRSNLIVVDRRDEDFCCYVKKKQEDDNIDKIYIDGSYLELKKNGGYAILHKDKQGHYDLYKFNTLERGSCRIELIAAIEALRRFADIDRIRIITDSQYVRKGLSEWMVCWLRNEFMTANGEKARNIDKWEEAEKLTQGRYIELEWVKAHSEHFENTICDLYAKESAVDN